MEDTLFHTTVPSEEVAAIFVEPIQGEGGVNVPSEDYLEKVSTLCIKNNAYLIVDEIQTGFYRTGTMFASDNTNAKADFMTMAKGIAGGFPFAAFAMTEEVATKLEKGDHGGTYCGNPLGCAVAYVVIKCLLDNKIDKNVQNIGTWTIETLKKWQNKFPDILRDVRGCGLLIAIEFKFSNS